MTRQHQMTRRGFASALACALGLGITGGLAACGNQASTGANDASSSSVGSAAEASSTRTFTDSCGRTVELPAEVAKVAPSGPLAQQILLTVDTSKLCGMATKLSDDQKRLFGDAAVELPVFGQIYGGKGDFNKESVADAAPDLIIDVGEAKDTIVEDMDNLQEQLGIACVHVEATLDTYDSVYEQLGGLLGEESRCSDLSAYCRNAYDEVNAVVSTLADTDRPKVAYLLGDSGLNAIAKGSYQGNVIDFVAENAIEVEKASGSGMGQEVSLEQIATVDPEMIVFGPDSIYDTVGSDSAWAGIAAIRDQNYFQVPSVPYNWLSSPPSVNQVLGMQWFARLCYPDRFQTGVKDVAVSYFKTLYGYDLSDEECTTILAGALPKGE